MARTGQCSGEAVVPCMIAVNSGKTPYRALLVIMHCSPQAVLNLVSFALSLLNINLVLPNNPSAGKLTCLPVCLHISQDAMCSVPLACRPHDRVPLSKMKEDWQACLDNPVGFKVTRGSTVTDQLTRLTALCCVKPSKHVLSSHWASRNQHRDHPSTEIISATAKHARQGASNIRLMQQSPPRLPGTMNSCMANC